MMHMKSAEHRDPLPLHGLQGWADPFAHRTARRTHARTRSGALSTRIFFHSVCSEIFANKQQAEFGHDNKVAARLLLARLRADERERGGGGRLCPGVARAHG